MKLKLKIWRQKNENDKGGLVNYELDNVSEHMSFLEMLDVLNEELLIKGKDPVVFDHDCREGICGMCSLVVNGIPHGPEKGTTVCQLHMRKFKDGETIYIEPWRASSFPVVKDLQVDRSAFDRIIQSGGFISANTGSCMDANNIPIPKHTADISMDAAACIGCGACVAACKNASAMLFVSAKIGHLNLLPQGEAEKKRRVHGMISQMDREGFGNCSNYFECEAVCPKEIKISFIAQMNRDFISTVGTDEPMPKPIEK